jgi:hypothetical protein
MWEVTYQLTPDRGYFDSGERVLQEHGIYLEAVHTIDYVSDGSVVIVYEIDGSEEALRGILDASPEKVVDYEITNHQDPLVAQLRFYPDEPFSELMQVYRTHGVSLEFPLRYIEHEPTTLEMVEVGPRDELANRIEATRDYASVSIERLHRYEFSTGQLFRQLTDRQQEVLLAAIKKGYYRTPREATQADIAEELSCSASVVGQHLRRIETELVSSVVPDPLIDEGSASAEGD